LLAEAQRLFRERGYAATSLEQIAEAAEVTKGAIYGHFTSKEDLMISAIEATPIPDSVKILIDYSRPLGERVTEFGRAAAAQEPGDGETLAMLLEFYAALLRAPDALRRYGDRLEQRLQEFADADRDELSAQAGVTPAQVWGMGNAMLAGLEIYQRLIPRLITPEAFERTLGLLAALYREQ
jgi:AcrR family transcriptional regulator